MKKFGSKKLDKENSITEMKLSSKYSIKKLKLKK